MDKFETIVTGAGEKDKDYIFDSERLAFGKVDGPGVTLAFLADNKTYVCGFCL